MTKKYDVDDAVYDSQCIVDYIVAHKLKLGEWLTYGIWPLLIPAYMVGAVGLYIKAKRGGE